MIRCMGPIHGHSICNELWSSKLPPRQVVPSDCNQHEHHCCKTRFWTELPIHKRYCNHPSQNESMCMLLWSGIASRRLVVWQCNPYLGHFHTRRCVSVGQFRMLHCKTTRCRYPTSIHCSQSKSVSSQAPPLYNLLDFLQGKRCHVSFGHFHMMWNNQTMQLLAIHTSTCRCKT